MFLFLLTPQIPS